MKKSKRGLLYCGYCNLYFSNLDAYESHCQNKKHIRKLLKAHKIKVRDIILPGEEMGLDCGRLFCPECCIELKLIIAPRTKTKHLRKLHSKIKSCFKECPWCETKLVKTLMKGGPK